MPCGPYADGMSQEQRVDVAARLRAAGYRVTRPRRAVWEALGSAQRHLTVEELKPRVADAGGDADQASIYRTLALFERLGLARQSRLGDTDAARWEVAHPDEHFHVVCTSCGEVDHHIGSLVGDIREHLEDGHGFAVEDIDLVVSGRCARCRGTQERG